MFSETTRQKISQNLISLYGEKLAITAANQIEQMADQYHHKFPKKSSKNSFNERDVILITYGDMVKEADHPPLDTLGNFTTEYAKGIFNGVHILPFFPYSSDDGFSVIDFKKVNPALGSWKHITRMNQQFRLMVDLVVNHVSASSSWFQGYLNWSPKYRDFFITVDDGTDLSKVVRPRALPLVTEVETAAGRKKVWATFSEDQIDLNYKNPQVLVAVLDILLFYIQMGADIIRLDAVAYIWKEIGTTCIHLPKVHTIIQLMRTLLNEVAPWVILVTETNVPHKDNISYFGDGTNEAQMVYNFSLPPLVLHTFYSGDARKISEWADNLTLPSEQVAFFNFLASHDGIGINPARGILTDAEIGEIINHVESLGGLISCKSDPEGFESPYELNINYFDALTRRGVRNEDPEVQIRRFITSHAIMLSLRGVPGCYFHSLVGSRSWFEGVAAMGYARAINREKLDYELLKSDLSDKGTQRARVYMGLHQLLTARSTNRSFSPDGQQMIIFPDSRVFALVRSDNNGAQKILCLHNISSEKVALEIDLQAAGWKSTRQTRNLLNQRMELLDTSHLRTMLDAYQTTWIEIQ